MFAARASTVMVPPENLESTSECAAALLNNSQAYRTNHTFLLGRRHLPRTFFRITGRLVNQCRTTTIPQGSSLLACQHAGVARSAISMGSFLMMAKLAELRQDSTLVLCASGRAVDALANDFGCCWSYCVSPVLERPRWCSAAKRQTSSSAGSKRGP